MALTIGHKTLCDWQQKIFDLALASPPQKGLVVITNHTRGNVGVTTLINKIRFEDPTGWLLSNAIPKSPSNSDSRDLFMSCEKMIMETQYRTSTEEAEKIVKDLIRLRPDKTTFLFLEITDKIQVPDLRIPSGSGQDLTSKENEAYKAFLHYVLSDSEEGKKNNGRWRGQDTALTLLS